MRRPVLLTLAAVGGVIVLLGGTGIFAALSDTARSGTNSIETDALPASSDLRVATASFNGLGSSVVCGTFSEDLVSPLFTISGPPGDDTGAASFYCLRNVGSQTVTLTALAEEFTETEIGCTGDESIFDTSCGPGIGIGGVENPGELGTFVLVAHGGNSCVTGEAEGTFVFVLLSNNTTTPAALGTLGPGQMRCFSSSIFQNSASPTQRQAAQSDRLTWRFAWTGQA